MGAFVLAVLTALACYHLGQWQYGRHIAKVERNARMDANYSASPRAVEDVIGPGRLPLDRQWTRVTAVGRYAVGPQLYVRNRAKGGVYGYEVVAPLALRDGGVLLVDRGWVANSDSGATVLPSVPPTPSGEVSVTGWALPGEASLGRTPPKGQLASINLAEAGAAWEQTLLGGYLRLDHEVTEAGTTANRPDALDPPDRSLGPHQAYAYQWWLTMPIGFVLMWFRIRAELRAEAEQAPGAARRDPKPKKVRIWDEEDA